jgi:predicted tellurium resistance membrane protein TerC
MSQLLTGEGLASFAALTFLELVLGFDNIIFLAMAIQRLAPSDRQTGRIVGLILAMLLRVLMLVALVWTVGLDVRLAQIAGHVLTIKDLVLIGGGLFLLAKSTQEIHTAMESNAEAPAESAATTEAWSPFLPVIVQIGMINIVFSLDSVVTAVGMTNNLPIMVAAVVASTLGMLFAAKPLGDFIHSRPTTKILALAFIILIGVALVADGLGFHIPRPYIYFAIAFSLFVEMLNSRAGRRRRPRPDQ